ncbi:MAG TPA: 1-(5-phosphoribosyl)-5-[(5-phosphoribosylamino)methylideneamino]imidazole-4-carboxamide isomerase [Planctomycetaceae bacterium]|jgi:phosphoribosylformimino-5-aminoimidazole carboxamide ribotide isomerase|nr:1-(5-phosphoribosyl)-5-[(5-phosphoribosylamino)methylideneamino]imidazole-4-carboxamide isomerase [Planctomycetaceae bacterium]
MEILPAIDLRGGQCVRLRQGDYNQETIFGDPLEMARRFVAEGATRLHLVDLDGARAGRPVNHEVVRSIVAAAGIPCQMGGGIRDESAIRLLLETVGIDRVIVGTQALKQPDWFRAMVQKFPKRIALGIDARDSMVATEGWLDVSKTPAIELARQYSGLDIAAVIYTNIANDGMMQGIDEATIGDLTALARLGFPVIASGGVTTVDDVRKLTVAARDEPRLVGAIIGRALYEGTITVTSAVVAAS